MRLIPPHPGRSATSNCTNMELKRFLIAYTPNAESASSNCTNMELKLDNQGRCGADTELLLIAPIWNWNVIVFTFADCSLSLLIAPIWNWNCLRSTENYNSFNTSNCTNMELKRGISISSLYCLHSPSNCTNMELKQTSRAPLGLLESPSNCTNMELKLCQDLSSSALPFQLLIAPIWNWNCERGGDFQPGDGTSNCTNMELKHLSRISESRRYYHF